MPFERAAAYGEVELATMLFKAGAKGNGVAAAARNGHRRVVSELLQHGASVASKDRHGLEAIHIAACHGHDLVVRTLLIEGADPDSFDSNGRTPLYVACRHGKVAVARALLAAGANVSLRVLKEAKYAPLDVAAAEGHAEVMRLLVERGAVVAAVDSKGRTALHFAAERGQAAAIEYLAETTADLNATDNDGHTPLLISALRGQESAVDALCVAGADMSCRAMSSLCDEPDSFAALDIASFHGNVSMMEMLLKHGADPNTRSRRNLTALHKAAEGNEAEAIDVLIKAGAVISGPAGFDSPVHSAVDGRAADAIRALARHGADLDWHEEVGATPLFRAVQWRHLEAVKALLAAGANPNISGNNETVLFASINYEIDDIDWGVLRALLEFGAKVNAANDDSETPLHAAANCHPVAVHALARLGAKIVPDSTGRTPLHAACSAFNLKTVAALLRHGPVINALDQNDDTPLHVAVEAEAGSNEGMKLELLEMLLAAGADQLAKNNDGDTPVSTALSLSRGFEHDDAAFKQIHQYLVRSLWWRRGLLLACHARVEQEVGRNKVARVEEAGDAAADDFRGLVAYLFSLRGGNEEIFRNILCFV